LAQTPTSDCDRLAAELGAVQGVAGIALEAIDVDAALAACAAAVAVSPTEARFSHQYGRALERAGRVNEARRLYEWAASDGYAQSEAALRRLAAAAAATGAMSSTTQTTAAAEGYAAFGAALRRYASTLPPDPADPLPLLAELGDSPDAMREWIAEKTRLVAYRGSLRGARGVLLDRSGNSLDRALLLATLLRNAGREVRVAHATLSVEQAQALLHATTRAPPVPSLPPVSEADTRRLLEAAGVDPSRVEEVVRAMADQYDDLRATIDQRVGALTPAIVDVVTNASTAAASSTEGAAVAALQNHYWVQLRTGQGWRDVDPHADELGAALTPAETFDPDTVPAGLRHAVTIRVIVELQNDTGRREEKLLEWIGHPDELIDQPITISHVPRSMPDIGAWLGSADYEARILAALDDESAWTPILRVGDITQLDKEFTRDGEVRVADANALAGVGNALGRVTTNVGSLLDTQATEVGVSAAIPTAEWLEVEIRVPGAEPGIQRRTVFDLVGPGARAANTRIVPTRDALRDRALRLLGVSRVLVTGANPSPAHIAHIATRDLATMADVASGVALLPPEQALASSGRVPTLPTALYAFAIERMHGRTVALVSPNVVMQHHRLGFDTAAGITEAHEIDIVHNAVDDSRSSFLTRLEQGVIDTVVEGLVLGERPGDRNAASIHAEDLAAGRAWVSIDSVSQLAAAPADFRARLETDLASGLIVIAPLDLAAADASDRLAWWRVDPRTGSTLGMLPNGGGGELMEYAVHVYHATHKFLCFVSIGLALGGHTNAQVGVMLCAAGALPLGGAKTVIGVLGLAYHVVELLHMAGVGGDH
jgi:hypothetical protein